MRQTEDPSLSLPFRRTDRRPRNELPPLNEVIKIVTGHAAAAYGWLGEGEGRESKREGRKFCQLQYYGSCGGALANRKPAAAGAGSSLEFMASEMARKCCHCLSSGRENKRGE